MKKLYLLLTILLTILIIKGCSDSTTDPPPGNNGDDGLLEGAVYYKGTYPLPAEILYHVNGIPYIVQGYPGQIVINFKASFKETDAINLITSNQGTVLGKIPKVGYYFVSVAPGNESAFINALQSNPNIKNISPNIQPEYMADSVLIIDNCSGSHGNQVVSTYTLNGGGGYLVNCQSDDDGHGHPVNHITTSHILLEAIKNNGGNTFINISTHGPELTSWEELMKIYLYSLLELPENLRNNLIMTICAGNDNLDLTGALENLRSDPLLKDLLKNNVLIVGATEQVFPESNDASSDPDFACMTSVESPNMSVGTSFAAPKALAIIYNIVNQYGISAKDALKIAKASVASNNNGELVQSEALDKAAKWKAALQHDPPGAINITSINFTSVGANTSAVIAPVIQNVTVSYTVSGTDGYYDSGIKYTSANGSVSFSIPAGAPGVVDLITVTAVLSGKMKSTHYTWDAPAGMNRLK